MTAFLRFQANDGTGLTVIDPAVPPGANPTILVEPVDWGNAQWETQASGPRGTQGRRPGGSAVQDRRVSLPLRIYGASKDDLTARISALNVVVEALRKGGGRITRRSHNQTYRQHLEVMSTPGLRIASWGLSAENRNKADVVFEAVCAPYALGDPMRVVEAFGANSLSEYSADVGASTNLAVAGGVLTAVLNLTTENRLIHTTTGYRYGDVQATLRFVPGTNRTSLKAGVVMCRRGSDRTYFIEVYYTDDGSNTILNVDKITNGVRVNIATTSTATRLNSGQSAWIRGRIEGSVVYAQLFTDDGSGRAPTNTATPFLASTTLLSANADGDIVFGFGRTGPCGFSWRPQDALAIVDDFEVSPYTYRAKALPDTWQLGGVIPGDVPALCSVRWSRNDDFAANTDPRWATFGWSSERRVNMCMSGNAYSVLGWGVNAVTGVLAVAGSSVTRGVSGNKYGLYSISILTPATANSGGHYRIARRFRVGTRYVAMAWCNGSVATLARIRLGVNGDIASTTAVALPAPGNAAPQLRVVSWIPAAETNEAWFVAEVTAATATTINLDGVIIFESNPAVVSGAMTAAQTTVNIGIEPPENWPALPFLALIDTEIVLVTARTGADLTIARGQQGSTAATHSSGALLHALPEDSDTTAEVGGMQLGMLRPHIGWESWPALTGLNFVDTSVAAAGEGYTATWNLVTDGLEPDEGRDTIDVEVYAKLAVGGALGQISTKLYAWQFMPGVTVSENIVYSIEHRTTPRNISYPSSADGFLTRFGTVRLPAGPKAKGTVTRLYLDVTVAAATNLQSITFEYAIALPAAKRIATPSGTSAVGLLLPLQAGAGEVMREVRADLSAYYIEPGMRPELSIPAPSIGGAPLEIEPGGVIAVTTHLNAQVPDEAAWTSVPTDFAYTVAIHPTPRWAHLR